MRRVRRVVGLVAVATLVVVGPMVVPAVGEASGPSSAVASVSGSAGFVGVSPARLLDTRSGGVTVDGAQEAGGGFGSGETRRLPVVGRGGVPAAGVGAVVVNVTVAGASAAGYVTVFPSGEVRPLASNLNYRRGRRCRTWWW